MAAPLCSRKRDSREAHDALLVDIPMLVVQKFAAGLRCRLQKRVEWRRSAPFQIVAVWPDQLPEAGGVGGVDAVDAGLIARSYSVHHALIGSRAKRIAVARAHVRHVHAEHPEEPVTLAVVQFRQSFREALHSVVVFRQAAILEAPRERSAENRDDS